MRIQNVAAQQNVRLALAECRSNGDRRQIMHTDFYQKDRQLHHFTGKPLEQLLPNRIRRKIGWNGKTIMDPFTVEVEIEHGRLMARQSHLLPETGVGLWTILPTGEASLPVRTRVSLPLVRCVPGTRLNPTAEELDESL